MKKALLCCLLLFAVISASKAQVPPCKRDSSVLKDTTTIIIPQPYLPTSPVYRMNEACINKPYLQYLTLEVPATLTVSGITAGLNSASIATTGAITNLPAGITYACDPPNCVFNTGTLGCLVLYGTPNMAKPTLPDTVELKIKASVSTTLFPVPIAIDIPGPVVPGNYYLIVKPAGAVCATTPVFDPVTRIESMKNTPNPFTGQTMISVESLESGEFLLEVFDLLGQRIHAQKVRLTEGSNQFTFDASHLANGTYVYSLSNGGNARASKRMVVNN